jgi:hypothetical protein
MLRYRFTSKSLFNIKGDPSLQTTLDAASRVVRSPRWRTVTSSW